MSVPKDRPQPGPGAPLTAEREQYRRLMAQGLNNHQACLQIGVHPTTGMRWSKGRNMVDHTGKDRYYPPIHAEPAAGSPRYLAEEERILIGDLLAAGLTQRSVAAELGLSPSTISREIRRNMRCRQLPAVRRAPQSSHSAGPGPDRASWPTTTTYGTSCNPSWSSGGVRSRSATHCPPSSPARKTGIWCTKPYFGPCPCRDAANCGEN